MIEDIGMSFELKSITVEKKPHLMENIVLGKIVSIRDQILKAQSEGMAVYRFESGDPSFSISDDVLKTIQKVSQEGKTHYPTSVGILELREAIISKLKVKNKIIVSSVDSIYVTHGAMNAIFSTIFCIVNPGDEVIIPDPMWPEIAENIKIARGIPVRVKLNEEDGFQYSVKKIEEKISDKTRAIYLNTPHNPTGAVLSKETLLDIIRVAKKYNLWIISDEAYEDILYEPYQHYSIASLAKEYSCKVVSIFSFSKSHAMSGLRLGYIVTQSSILKDRLPKILRCAINGANSITQWAGITALEKDHDYIEFMRIEYRNRRDVLLEELSKVKDITVFIPKGSFFIWIKFHPAILQRLKCKDSDQVSEYLSKIGIGSIPGTTFGESNSNYARFAFSCNTEMVIEGANALREALTPV
ncbi:MAG: Aspartate aminotransferase [Candidatus Heimdallarchaeota archaeon LC_2]|nr:MAG: Aspartate aminotransferase [Candidatus Heimdallarchaeota archaeon LC_2]